MSRVIKSDSPMTASPVGRATALNVANFAEQAQKMVLEAQTKASQILAQATAKARQVEQAAAERGYAEGFQKGLIDGQADGAERAFSEAAAGFTRQTADLQAMLKKTILQLEADRGEILQQAREELLDLALEIASKVTHVQAAGDVAVAQAQLAKAVEMVSCQGQIQARVCPAQLQQLQEYAGQFLDEMGLTDLVKFVPDEQLAAGDVVLASRNGEVDARIETQLNNVLAALTGRAREAVDE